MVGSQKLKKAIAKGKVVVHNPTSGEVRLFLYNSTTGQQFFVDISPMQTLEIAPRLCSPQDTLKSRNFDELLSGTLRLK